jgi:hypothetical protein
MKKQSLIKIENIENNELVTNCDQFKSLLTNLLSNL